MSNSKKATTPTVKPRKAKQVVTITPEQFSAGVRAVTRAFESIQRIEHSVSSRNVPMPAPEVSCNIGDGVGSLRQMAVNSKSDGPPPVEIMVQDLLKRVAGISTQAKAIRERLTGGIMPEGCNEVGPTFGPTKNQLLAAFSLLNDIEFDLNAISQYTIC